MEVLHIVGKVGQSSFGIGEVVLNLALHQIKYHCRSRIWCVQSTLQPDGLVDSGLGPDAVKDFRAFGPKFLFYTPQMESAARSDASETRPTVLHQHGIWTALSRVTTVLRKNHKLPAVVAAHGALRHRRFESPLGKRSWPRLRMNGITLTNLLAFTPAAILKLQITESIL